MKALSPTICAWRGVKIFSQRVTESTNEGGVCRAAPGFAWAKQEHISITTEYKEGLWLTVVGWIFLYFFFVDEFCVYQKIWLFYLFLFLSSVCGCPYWWQVTGDTWHMIYDTGQVIFSMEDFPGKSYFGKVSWVKLPGWRCPWKVTQVMLPG